ncbi:WYL domain-containing protein [Pseudomonas aeruginosa]|uniref:helix-turn-helix transcriptional regulator n=1 Tax=Gammaproteobacteria TaxID=1236 RepID=UPI00053E34BB|nr:MULTISPECIES: WYL domain-containing protein [Gammaproteobacteria]HCM5076421.1 WYL domain-containing protein [Klebsiella quasipneumoniae subsp. similipneumoniae]EIU4989950.1 WYL domain-containing protein [Pseudomonas aeruginosa]EIY2606004.1 WYL domain-containing protein [Pseudomonas aeruginosa]EIY2737677.1 WYL domain-containing protein [Pseudomonas aeruginosa]EKB4878007.1 WYL domain-containing protein [Pseudomonas aeruginosa]
MQNPPVATAEPVEPKGLSWGLESRLQFIDFRLRWERRINRMDLTEYFGISVPQASLDIAKYTELAPNNLTYDRSSKTYTAAPSFRPLYQRSSAQRYLAELLATKMGVVESTASFIGSAPETDWAPSPWRTIDEQTVELVVRAIRQQEAIRVSYQSMTSLNESIRLLSPHALGYDGFRWHVRAFCHKRQRFSDFVLARILRIDGIEPSQVDFSQDTHWHTVLTLILAPHPDLPAAKKRVLELDYGMEDGQVKLPCRQAFLYYTLRRLGLHTKEAPDPLAQQIALKNRDDIQPYIDALTAQA